MCRGPAKDTSRLPMAVWTKISILEVALEYKDVRVFTNIQIPRRKFY